MSRWNKIEMSESDKAIFKLDDDTEITVWVDSFGEIIVNKQCVEKSSRLAIHPHCANEIHIK